MKEKIVKALENKSEEEIQKELLEEFGFLKITEFMTRSDGSIVVDDGLSGTYEIECELWIDYKNKRALLYTYGYDLNFIDGDLTKKEDKIYYN